MADNPVRHLDEEGAIYAAEIVPPEPAVYDAKYHVDLVRTSVDAYGLEREQRLTVGQHNSWLEAEEHLNEVESALETDGVAGWGEDVERLQEQPFAEDLFYLTATYPPDAREGQDSAAQLLTVGENGIARVTLAVGEREAVERVVDQLDLLDAEEGTDRLLEAAQIEAEVDGGKPSDTPLFGYDDSAVLHVDGGGTAHWFAITERDEPESEPYELRYFRALALDDGTHREDSHPVIPLPDDDPASAWPLPGLEMYLAKGDVHMAQQFAHDVADSYGQAFPEPLDLPALDPRPEYYFGYGVGPSSSPSLEAVKTWMDGPERRFDTLTVGEYGMFDEAAVNERELESLLEENGVEAALNLAESMAVAGGYLDSNRDDPRIFFENDAPDDPFISNRERELDIVLAGETPPSESQVNYAFTLAQADPHTLELRAEKAWGEDGETMGVEILELRQYDTNVPDHHLDGVHETAALDREELVRIREETGLETAMQQAEEMAVELGTLDPGREDPRLFTQGPPDPFTTRRERELAGPEYSVGAISANGESFLDVMKTWGMDDYERLAIPQPNWELAQKTAVHANDLLEQGRLEGAMRLVEDQGVAAGVIDPERDDPRLFTQGPPDPFQTLREEEIDDDLARYGVTIAEAREWEVDAAQLKQAAEVDNPHWRLETLPVSNPDGEPLGHALHMVVYPGVEHDPEQVGVPEIPQDAPFRMLEVAHFETTEAANEFGKEFHGYLMPGLLEGPELAEEVARLEGHPVEWKTLEGQELEDYRDLKLTLTRDPADWQPYNPNAERDARIEAEGLHTDLLHQSVTPDKDDPKVETTAPDFDL